MITVISIILILIAAVWITAKGVKAKNWHEGGVGELKGKAEYGRIKREEPDSPDAKLSEAEFVVKFVSSEPGVVRYALLGFVIAFVAIPASCVMSFIE